MGEEHWENLRQINALKRISCHMSFASSQKKLSFVECVWRRWPIKKWEVVS